VGSPGALDEAFTALPALNFVSKLRTTHHRQATCGMHDRTPAAKSIAQICAP
jgi:hypothetical protein